MNDSCFYAPIRIYGSKCIYASTGELRNKRGKKHYKPTEYSYNVTTYYLPTYQN
jgi:hypothetical protein